MARIAIGIEYDGSAFSGWQVQAHARSVQAELAAALARVADHPVALTAAGRTDAGVHALQQVAHFDSDAVRPDRAWVLGANAHAPRDLSVLWSRVVPDGFHARFDALSRSYVYRILNRRERPALERARLAWVREPLDAEAMHDAAQCLLGSHDFSAFRAAECQSRTALRRVLSISAARSADVVEIRVTANAFLHHMVRNIAGSLIAVGCAQRPAQWLEQVLAARERKSAGITAPPQGLYFAGASYPSGFGLPLPRLPAPGTPA